MKYRVFSLLFILFFVLSSQFLFSTDKIKPRVGILEFQAKSVPEVEADSVGEIFTTELVMTGRFDVVDRKNVENLLEEMDFQLSGCTDSSCAVEVGQILSLEYMIYGSVIKLGRVYSINIQMINVATAQIVKSGREEFRSMEDAYDVIPRLVAEFTGSFGADEKPPPETFATGRMREPRPQRERTGMIVFFSGAGLTLGSGLLWIATAEYNGNELWLAHDNYSMAEISELQLYKEEYLSALRTKNIMLFSSIAVTAVGVTGAVIGSLLWFRSPDEMAAVHGSSRSAFHITLFPAGVYLSFEIGEGGTR